MVGTDAESLIGDVTVVRQSHGFKALTIVKKLREKSSLYTVRVAV